MTTLAQVVERTRARLGGNATTASTYLTQPVTATDLTIPLESPAGFSRGLAEIGFELIRVDSVDNVARHLHTPPYGRGYRATTAAAHAAGDEVLFAPTWPAAVIAEEINGVITSLYPDLYVVRYHETTVPANRNEPLDLPATAVGVIGVWVEVRGLTDVWVPEDRWRYDPDSTTDDRPLRIGGYPMPGTAVRIAYAEAPGLFDLSNPSADFETVTGFPERIADLLALGVAARMAPFLELSRLPVAGAEAKADAQAKPPGAAASLARLLNAEYRQRVEDERRVLHKAHPIRVHRTGVR